ncbi:MAG: cytochrome b562 [Formivibrio sp.]|nr:cytochrome b562 [Formivibrio sp.]
MKKLLSILACALFCSAIAIPSAFADVNVKPAMKSINTHFKAASSAKDISALKTELIALRDAVKKTQAEVQAVKQPSNDEKTYLDGMGKLLSEIDNSVTLAETGKYDEAKASLGKIKALRGEYHKKLGV